MVKEYRNQNINTMAECNINAVSASDIRVARKIAVKEGQRVQIIGISTIKVNDEYGTYVKIRVNDNRTLMWINIDNFIIH